MILLNGHSLTPSKRIPLESMSLKLKERESTADIVPADMTGITMQSWMKDDTEPGKNIVWRVVKIQQAYADRTPTVTLEHAIGTLRDRILFGEITAETITGVSGATTCTALQAVNYILARQSDWVLDSFDYSSVTNAYKFDGDNLFDALERVSETLEDPWWSYDTTVYPFKISITHKQSGTACEMRPGRNLVSVNRTIDKNGMYTRFWPIGKEDLHIPGNYVEKNVSLYGAIDHVETDITKETAAELTAWANDRLNRHAEPRVTTTADGLELAEATGEPLDKLKLGRICRMPLPEYGTTIEERITELNYRDKIHQPEVVRITMGNQQDDIMKLIADEMKNGAGPIGSGRGGGGGRGGARQLKEDHAWFEDTDEHVAMVAEGIIGVDASGNPNWTRLAALIVDGTGIHANVHDLLDEIIYQNADIEVNEQGITTLVSKTGINSLGQSETLYSRIQQNAESISLKVSKGSVISEINQTAETVRISASKIDLDGYVTASELSTTNAAISNLTSGVTTASSLKATAINAVSGFTYQNHAVSFKSVTIGGTQYHLMGYQ